MLYGSKKKNTEFATEFVNNIKRRESALFESEIVLAAIYMDPRYNVILTDAQIRAAKDCLLNTDTRIEELCIETEKASNEDNSCIIQDTSHIVEEDEFESLLKNAEAVRGQTKSRNSTSSCSVENKLDDFLKESRLKSSTDILSYWNNKNTSELYKLAEVLLTVPPTQVSVERLFSALKFILSPHRSRMNGNLVNDILVIRLNRNKIIDN